MNSYQHYLLDRSVTAVLSIFGAMILVFVLFSFMPGDPATAMLGPLATPEYAQRFIEEMGLDKAIHIRFWRFMSGALTGDLGTDVVSGQSVAHIIANALPYTIVLAFSAMGLACLIGIPAGVFCAVRKGSVSDSSIALVSVIFVSVPSFILGIFLLVIFSVWLKWLPVLGTSPEASFGDQIQRLILPTIALALGYIGMIARLVRTSMLDTLHEDFIRTSRAYGLNRRLILYKYALKNAIIPTLAVIGMGFGRLLGGAVLIEILFARYGLGTVLYNALQARNFSVLQGSVFVVVVVFVVVNLLVEFSYSLVDPRMRQQKQ